MQVRIVTQITENLVKGLSILLPQLSESATLPDSAYLKNMISSGATALFVAEDEGGIIGTLTLGTYYTPTGRKAWIEDVVTDRAARGKGAGMALVNAAIDYAKENAIGKIDLTSGNSRQAARELYRKAGFTERETAVFRIEL